MTQLLGWHATGNPVVELPAALAPGQELVSRHSPPCQRAHGFLFSNVHVASQGEKCDFAIYVVWKCTNCGGVHGDSWRGFPPFAAPHPNPLPAKCGERVSRRRL